MAACSSVAVFLFFAIALVLPSGYSLGALLLALGSLVLLSERVKPELRKEDFALITILTLYFLVCILTNQIHGAPAREYDVPTRFVLAIPALLLLRAYPPRPGALWGGVAAGAICAGLLAGWEMLIMKVERAAGYTNPIQFGNISVLLGILCLAGLPWALARRRAVFWTGLLIAGAGMGILGSLLTGSRGSWISLPFCLLVLYKCYGGMLHKRYFIAGLVAIVAIFATIYATPRTEMKSRLEKAVEETHDYFQSRNADTSVGARLDMWRTGLMMFPERPWLGWGKEGYMERKAQLIEAGEAAAFTRDHTHLHNEYLDALVKRGLPGLAILSALYIVPLLLFSAHMKPADRIHASPYAVAGVLLIVCYMVFGLTQAFFTHNNGVMMFAFTLVILWSLLRKESNDFSIECQKAGSPTPSL
jgi:O-antigen ligase